MNCKICLAETHTVLCPTCYGWATHIAKFKKSQHANQLHLASINHRLFMVYDDTAEIIGDWPHRIHEVKFTDGVVVTTNKIIQVGEIPFRFRKQLPTNATFLNPRHRCMECERRYVPTLSDELCFYCAVTEGD